MDEEILDQFLGDDTFPIVWNSEAEKRLFWVFDDLHCPHPLSPMFEDIGGWWLTCDHMFRRFGTPFATDWVYKNVNGYLYTAAVPPESDLEVTDQRYNLVWRGRVPIDPDYPSRIGKYLDAVLPVYGANFVRWWRDRLVPEMQRNFAYLEQMLADQDSLSLVELAVLLEDAIDIHDRHWKIHWMLNFAQLSATLNLRSVMESIRGKVDEGLLGRLQNSSRDRNWDSIAALWAMKEEVKGDAELATIFQGQTAGEIIAGLEASDRGRRFIAERVRPYQKEFGWHAVWSHELIFPTVYEQMDPVVELVRDYLRTDYDYPTAVDAVAADIRAATEEVLRGLEGQALEEMRAAVEMNLNMAPLTPDHHFYIDQGANAHLRMVLLAIGKKLVAANLLDDANDVFFFRYNELRVFIADPMAMDGRAVVNQRKKEREKAYRYRPRPWIGTATKSQLAFPYLVNWGFPDKFYRQQGAGEQIQGIAASPGTVEGAARVVLTEDEFDQVENGEILVCQMTNPAWVVLFTKIAGLVTDAGGTVAHPAVLAREFGIPAVVGTSVATARIRSGDRIRVDGTKGIVEILAPAAPLAGPSIR